MIKRKELLSELIPFTSLILWAVFLEVNQQHFSIFINSISWNPSISSSVQSRWSDHSSACRNDTGHLNASGLLIIHIYFSYPPNCISYHFSNVFLLLSINCMYWNLHIIIFKSVFLPGMIKDIRMLLAIFIFNCLSIFLPNIFLEFCQMYFFNSINCISRT